jgi:plastocyanin
MTKRTFVASLAVLLTTATGLAACGGDDADVAAPSDADVVVEALDGNKFDLDEYTASAGDVIIAYLGLSATNHTLLVVDTENVQIGDKLSVTSGETDQGTFPLAAGSYTLLCDVPGHENMKATLLVS